MLRTYTVDSSLGLVTIEYTCDGDGLFNINNVLDVFRADIYEDLSSDQHDELHELVEHYAGSELTSPLGLV